MSWLTLLTSLLPEHLLLAGIVVIMLVEIAGKRSSGALGISVVVVAAAAVAALWLYSGGYAETPFVGHFSADPDASLGKAIVLALALPALLMARDEFRDTRFPLLVLSSLYGVCFVLSSDSFLTMFIGLELMSLPVYVLVLLAFRRPECAEAALKYLVLGGTASATFLMGVSLLYGTTGTLSLGAFADLVNSDALLARAAIVLVIASFFLKAAVFPFHAWAPDAYEGASVPVTAYMATVIKAAVVLAAVRLFASVNVESPMLDLLALLPLVSIVWGNLAAMRQDSFRRMIAYSSIAHAGYLFYAFLGDGAGRFEAVAFYVLAYGLMNMLAFASIPTSTDDKASDRLANLKGLYRRNPFAAVMLGIAMLSLAGIPPFPGFVAKFLIFKNVIAAGYTLYAVLGLVGSYVGIYFYLRVIQYAFMSADADVAEPGVSRRLAVGASLLCLVPTLALIVFPGWVIALM
jgi:NADH-quinone oxidoreductase subunit N